MRASFWGALFLLLTISGHPAGAKEMPEFGDYAVPLNEQVVNRIRSVISAKLGDGPNTQDRYFIVPFAYENKGNSAEFSHSFISVIKVLADGKSFKQQPKLPTTVRTGTYRQWKFEAYTISWIPKDFLENPHLCTFEGPGARIFPEKNTCPLVEGKTFSLEETLLIAKNAKVAVGMWGPYEISKGGFDLGVRRKTLLESGQIKYRADDRLYRDKQIAINCFHAMASLDQPFPAGGAFGTGFKMWGLNGTARVLMEYTSRANRRGLLLDPVDIKNDRYGFVYAPAANSKKGIYNPFKNSSAYCK